MGKILWLASYPKSGNTWVRAFLTNYRSGEGGPASINDLDGGPIASSRMVFDEWVGIEAAELTPDEIAAYRHEVYRRVAADTPELTLVKAHDAYRSPSGRPLFPADATAGAIYILRNPLDVAVSLAHYQAWSMDRAVEAVCAGFVLSPAGERLHEQLEQVLAPWSEHVSSWADQSEIPVHLVRFEDLIVQPVPAFRELARAAMGSVDEIRLERAVEQSSFQSLRAQEVSSGFKERPLRAAAFFRKGAIGDWRHELNPTQVREVVSTLGAAMARFGYLDEHGDPR